MKILITGCDGYIGWPVLLKLCLQYSDFEIVGVDNFSRRKWVSDIGAKPYFKIASFPDRIKELKKFKKKVKFKFYNFNLIETKKVYSLLSSFRPDLILHLASQPSAPFANENIKNAIFTSNNNNISTLNLLWSLKELKLSKTIFFETTTTGVYGAPNLEIPEGFLKFSKDVIRI